MARRFFNVDPSHLSEAAEEIAGREQPVASTAIASVSYNFISDDVTINFTDGSTYIYSGVPLDDYVGLVRASSKGEYFNANIRNNYSYVRS